MRPLGIESSILFSEPSIFGRTSTLTCWNGKPDVLFFKHSFIQSEPLNGQQMATMIQNSVLDAGLDVRELSHRFYRTVSMHASLMKANAPSDSWTCTVTGM